MKRFKKLITVLFAVVMFLSAFCLATPHASEVKAADAGVSGSNITRGKIPNTVPEGKLFAGWYKDSELTIPAKKILDNRTYYPKYVDEGVLSIKVQVKTRDDGKVNMRIISSVDELNYEYVGFDIYFDTDAVNETNKVNFETKKVQQRVDASVTGVTYDYSPKVVDTDSEYFVTGTITGIASTKLDKYFYIKPYWKTLDGTKVYGVNRYCSVENGTDDSNINIPVKMSNAPTTDENKNLQVQVGNEDKSAKLVAYKEGYAHLNIAVASKKSMSSATKISVGEAGAIYRNLDSTCVSNGEDKSWYEVYDAESETEFVIATDADLYGFSALSNNDKKTFAGKTVYMVADISANEDATVDGKSGSVTGTPYTWNPIGPDGVTFAGTFDGQGHTISNIYYSDTANTYDHGFFGVATDTTIVRNFSIKDSYFNAGLVAGSVAGKPKGTFESIYSDAYIKTSGQYSGGLFGSMETDAGKVTIIDNCWFAGTVNAGNHKAGGVVGHVSAASSKNNIISNCLVTGTISSSGQEVGGLCGYIVNGTPMYLSNCVTNATLTGTNYVGGIIGWLNENTGANSKTIINDVYTTATTGSGYGAMRYGTISAGVDLVGDNGFVNTMLDFDKYWTTVDGGIPELRTFATTQKEAPNVNRIYAASLDWTFDVAGTEEDPYLLEDAADLLAFTTNPWSLDFDGKVVKLKNDIAFNVNINDTTNRKAWTKIGSSTKAYNGTFDGQGYTISGVFYNDTSATWDHGFFGVTGSNAVIQNFSLVDSYFKGADVVGSIAGKPNGTFKNIYSNAKVEGARWIGGFFGNIENTATTTIENCWFDGQVNATGIETGGLVGYITTSGTTTVDNCLVTGSVTSSANYLGGFFGSIKSDSPVVLTNSITTTTPDGAGFEASIVGNLNGVTKDTSKVILNNVFTTSPNASGANGAFKTNGAVIVENLEGKNGYIHTLLDFDKYWTILAEGTPELRTFAETELSEPTGNRQIVGDTHWLYTAAGTEADPYLLEDAADLLGFAEESTANSFEGKVVKLKNDITINADIANATDRTAWTAIGNAAGAHSFNGTFDGQGYTISGIYYEYTSNSYDHGFFGITGSSAVIQNFQLKNSYFKGPNVVGSIAGKPNGTFKNIYSDAIVEGTGSNDTSRWIGGFFGSIEQGMGPSVENCWFDGVIKNTGNVTGGFIGQITATDKTTVINNCLVTGTMENQNGDGGGFCGAIAATSKVRLSDSLITTVPNGSGAKGSMIGNPCSATKENSQVVLNNVYTTNSGEVCGKTGVFRTEGPVVVEDIKGQNGYVHTLLDFDKYWTTVDGDIPELRTFAKVVQNAPIGNRQIVGDTHWLYTAAGTEADPYILEDAADLLGFAQASSTNNFEGKVIKLKNDITLNADIENATNRTAWPMIGNASDYAFNGTFDGQGHTISGIYYNSGDTGLFCHGFFGYTGSKAKVQNFRLTESYFHGPDVVGSIAGKPSGTFKNIYSNAKVEATGGSNGRYQRCKSSCGKLLV